MLAFASDYPGIFSIESAVNGIRAEAMGSMIDTIDFTKGKLLSLFADAEKSAALVHRVNQQQHINEIGAAMHKCAVSNVKSFDDQVSDARLVALQLSKLCDNEYKYFLYATISSERIAEQMYFDREVREETFADYVILNRKHSRDSNKN